MTHSVGTLLNVAGSVPGKKRYETFGVLAYKIMFSTYTSPFENHVHAQYIRVTVLGLCSDFILLTFHFIHKC